LRDEWYTEEKLAADLARLREAGGAVRAVSLDAGHDWTAPFAEAAAEFLRGVRQ
jgi:hypothetical protein